MIPALDDWAVNPLGHDFLTLDVLEVQTCIYAHAVPLPNYIIYVAMYTDMSIEIQTYKYMCVM